MSLFSEQVYTAVSNIPLGKVMSYGQIAAVCGRFRASRIVGQILHNNPTPIVVPCHRVVFKDGHLTDNFGFGEQGTQRKLLEDEGVEFDIDGKVKREYFATDYCGLSLS